MKMTMGTLGRARVLMACCVNLLKFEDGKSRLTKLPDGDDDDNEEKDLLIAPRASASHRQHSNLALCVAVIGACSPKPHKDKN